MVGNHVKSDHLAIDELEMYKIWTKFACFGGDFTDHKCHSLVVHFIQIARVIKSQEWFAPRFPPIFTYVQSFTGCILQKGFPAASGPG